MNAADFVAFLDGVKQTAPGRWLARCPAHDDKNPSLAVREAEDGRTLLCCFAGCDAGAVAGAVGVTLKDLFPQGSPVAAHGVRTPVPITDVLEAIEVEALTVCIIAADMVKGQIDERRRARLQEAAFRIPEAIENGKERRLTNAIAESDRVTRAQAFLDARLEKLRMEHSGKLDAYLDPASMPMLRSPMDYLEELNASFQPGHNSGALLPWGKTHDKVAFRKCEVTVWAGQNGSGKSLVLGQCILDWINQGEKVFLASFEMKPVEVLKRMARQASGGRHPSDSFLDSFVAWLAKDRAFWFIDHKGAIKSPRVLAEIRYAIAEEGCTQIVIDNMGQVIRKDDDYSAQKDFVTDLVQTAHDGNGHIHLIHHIRKGGSVMDVPDKFSVRGASAITDSVDQVILVWKDAKKMRRGTQKTRWTRPSLTGFFMW